MSDSKWKVLDSQTLMQSGFFKMRADTCELPDGRVMPQYYVFEFSDWVNVIPITGDGQVALLRQYRHAAGQTFLEIPGGSTNPGQNEDPQRAGERELLEETGYKSNRWIHCGTHFPNPALQNNRLHTFVALDCERVAEPHLDPFEDLVLELKPWQETFQLWQKGEFKHSLMAASIGIALVTLQNQGFSF